MTLKTRKPTGRAGWPKILVEGGDKAGKAQPLHARIATPSGWTTMGELEVGSRVIGSDGRPVAVTAVYERGERDIYRLTFSDGAQAEACDEHLWATTTSSDLHRTYNKGPKKGQHWYRPPVIRTTAELREKVLNGTVVHIPMTGPVQYDAGETLPLDPYALGLLLGDGGLSKRSYPSFTSGDPELIDALATLIPDGDTLTPAPNKPVTVGIKGGRTTAALRSLGLISVKSADKFMPASYMTASPAHRLALLQGLMDTDGGMEWKSITFTSVSYRMACQLQELVRSLGGSCSMRSKRPSYRAADGSRIECQIAYKLTMRLPIGVCPFRLARKVEHWTKKRPTFNTPPRRTVKAVEYVGKMPARCITVDAEDHLYLTDGFAVTHNSWSLAQLSASPKVGRTVVLVLGEDETRWDEYGKITGARFDIAVHDGTWASIIEAVEGAKEEAAAARDAGEPPFVLGIDTMTAVWEGLKDWATLRARSSKKNRALLAQDPDAEIDVTSNYWNDARRRHRNLMRHLLTFPGIVVLIARGGEVTAFHNGQPVAGQKTWSVEGEKNLPYDVSVHVRLSRDSRPLLVSASGVHCQIRPGIDPPRRLPDDWSLESVIFDTLKLDAATAEVREFTEFKQETTPEEVRDEALDPKTDFARIRELYAYSSRAFPGVALISETGDEELLLQILKRIGDERGGKPAAAAHANGHAA